MDAHGVPDELIGCWKRAWIEFADGSRDDTTFVIWLQLASKMVDIRIRADRPDLSGRSGLGDCSLAELDALADSESSSGYTTCTPIETGPDGVRRATAEWFTRGHGVAFQPVSAFPEPGLLEWNADGTVMIERAPSGAYTEEWHVLADTSMAQRFVNLDDGSEVYLAGDVAVLVRDRPTPIPRLARLPDLIAECGDDRAAVEALLDCEFSFARRTPLADATQSTPGLDDASVDVAAADVAAAAAAADVAFVYVIEASTLPWREGKVINVAF